MIGLFQPETSRRLSGHPITDKLVMAVNFAHTDAIVTLAGTPMIPEDTGVAGPGLYVSGNVSYTQGINRYGKWAGFGSASFNSKFDWTRSDFIPTTQGCTVLMLYEKADATPRASCAFILNVSGNPTSILGGQTPWSDGNVYWFFGGVGGANLLSASGLSFGADCWVFSAGGRGMEIWQNGSRRASNGNTPTRTANGAAPFVLGAKSADAVFSDIAHYNLFAMWARQLTQDEILLVSADPYMLWESPSVPWYLSAVTGEGEAEAPSEHPYAGGLTIYKVTPERWG